MIRDRRNSTCEYYVTLSFSGSFVAEKRISRKRTSRSPENRWHTAGRRHLRAALRSTDVFLRVAYSAAELHDAHPRGSSGTARDTRNRRRERIIGKFLVAIRTLVSARYFLASPRPWLEVAKRNPSANENPWRGHGVPVALTAPPYRGRRAERQRCGVAWLGASDRSACVFVVLREYLKRILNSSYSPFRARGLTSKTRGWARSRAERTPGETKKREKAWARERKSETEGERARRGARVGRSERREEHLSARSADRGSSARASRRLTGSVCRPTSRSPRMRARSPSSCPPRTTPHSCSPPCPPSSPAPAASSIAIRNRGRCAAFDWSTVVYIRPRTAGAKRSTSACSLKV